MQRSDCAAESCIRQLAATALALLLAACSGQDETAGNAELNSQMNEGSCADESAPDSVMYLCGPLNAEDILRLGDSDWLLASGMNGELAGDASINGRLHLVNLRERRWEVLFPGEEPRFEHNTALYPDCPGPLDTSNFSVHGLALGSVPGQAESYRLYITSHGAREAIETFIVDASGKPTVTWTGCVPMPETSWTNSVVILDDGGFMATQFMDPTRNGIAEVRRGEVTGGVFEWHPGTQPVLIEGTGLPGPNGITISEDQRYLYVASFGGHQIVRFDLQSSPLQSAAARIDAEPDNVRWGPDGALYTAGGNLMGICQDEACTPSWSLWRIDPQSLQSEKVRDVGPLPAFGMASSVLPVGDEFWVGTYSGDRLVILQPR